MSTRLERLPAIVTTELDRRALLEAIDKWWLARLKIELWCAYVEFNTAEIAREKTLSKAKRTAAINHRAEVDELLDEEIQELRNVMVETARRLPLTELATTGSKTPQQIQLVLQYACAEEVGIVFDRDGLFEWMEIILDELYEVVKNEK